MKVLWLCNVIIPQICNVLHIDPTMAGGWLNQLADHLDQNRDIRFGICAPYNQIKEIAPISWGHDSVFFGFQNRSTVLFENILLLEEAFQKVLKEFKPDIVHIFGTEYVHSLAMIRAFRNPEKTVIHIQGLVSFYSKHYTAFLPEKVIKRYTINDLRWKNNILNQKKKFEIRGKFEIEAIKNVSHVMGRTDWDCFCAKWINPQIHYHYVQEMMRKPFYEGNWKLDKCEKYSIFMSQGNYPIKGLHLALEALKILKEKYENVKLYVAGNSTIYNNNKKEKLKETYYLRYIRMLIRRWNLKKNIVFTGILSAEEMKNQYLSSHVFLSPSVIENSPNSIGEAMLLGVPIVASDVGGVSSLIDHRKNGFLYPADAPYMLAYYVGQVFEENILAEKMSQIEKMYALELYDRKKILKQVEYVYQCIML